MRRLRFLGTLFALLMLFSGCTTSESLAPVTPLKESYECSAISRVYSHPAMLTVERQVEYLSLAIDDGWFFCATAASEEADEFINAQRTLLQFLRDSDVETAKLNYYAMDTDDSFSESDKKRAHIALSCTKSYQQVLVTLQTLWGDYTDYGYLYAVSNAIAMHLGWQTDAIEEVEQTALNTFFAENPAALNLLYPCFTTAYASEETVRNCKVLSKQLVKKINLREALAKPIDEQVNDFRALVDVYAQELSVTFSRQESSYAYYGKYIPLKISTPYVQHFIDRDYDDAVRIIQEELGDNSWDYFSDYRSIFTTIDIINEEIASSVTHFDMEEEVGIVAMNWLSAESAAKLSVKDGDYYLSNYYTPTYEDLSFAGRIYLTQINAYLHEYFHHLDFTMNHKLDHSWQAQAFAELGRARSLHGHRYFEWDFLYDEIMKGLFLDCFGREYQSGLRDYYEAHDFLCYITNSYEFSYYDGIYAMNSFTYYLLDLYGEDAVYQILWLPETVETVTGKTWEELEDDWQQHLVNKFTGFEVPQWIYE